VNFLVLPLFLFRSNEGLSDLVQCDVSAAVGEIYEVGKFDGLLIVGDGNSDFAENFPFANVHTTVVKNGSTPATTKIVAAIEKFIDSVVTQCLFTIVCPDDCTLECMARMIQSKHCVCFTQLKETTDDRQFTTIPLAEHDDQQPCNYFMGKVAKYNYASQKRQKKAW
jgi:hypothetical protein